MSNLSEVLKGKVINGYEAEPIIDRAGNILAVKISTRRASPNGFFRQAGKPARAEKTKLLQEQLSLIDQNKAYFQKNNILCAITIDFDMAAILIQEEEVAALAKAKPFLRLEISEDFPNLCDGRSSRVLQALAEEHRLWLGDLGSGQSNLRALQENIYEAVKIDNVFFNVYYNSAIWPVIIKNIMRYCKFIIVGGVETTEQLHALDKNIKAVQGGCFKSVRFENVGSLNKNLLQEIL